MNQRIKKFQAYRDAIQAKGELLVATNAKENELKKLTAQAKSLKIPNLPPPFSKLNLKKHYSVSLKAVSETYEQINAFFANINPEVIEAYIAATDGVLKKDASLMAQDRENSFVKIELLNDSVHTDMTKKTQIANHLGEQFALYSQNLPKDIQKLEKTLIKAQSGLEDQNFLKVKKIKPLSQQKYKLHKKTYFLIWLVLSAIALVVIFIIALVLGLQK